MAQKTYKDIEAEAERRFGKKASREKFEFRRAQQAAAGLEQESKTRGGVAGAYDRNKALVKTAATGLAGLLGGPMASSLVGGAIGGLDRPGRGGIGFDLGGAARGAATGAATGALAATGAGALRGAMGPLGAVQGAVQGARGYAQQIPGLRQMVGGEGGLPAMRGVGTGARVVDAARTAQGAVGGAGQMAAAAPSALRSLLTNPQVLAGAAGGVADVMGQRSQQRIQEQQLAQQGEQFQQRFGVEEEERKRQQEQANRLAAMFMPRR